MREFNSPAKFSIPTDATAVDVVFDYGANSPNTVVYKRRVDGLWVDVTAAEFAGEVEAVARGLIASGLQPGERVGLMSSTRYEWPLLDYAIWAAGGITVPIYETSAAEQVAWILQDSEARFLIVETPRHRVTFESIVDRPVVDRVFQIDEGAVSELATLGRSVAADQVRDRVATLHADSAATLIYTSGTTGRPKGCELTHANLLSETSAVLETSFADLLQPGRSSLLFLPMAHVFARAVSLAAFTSKVTIGHTSDTKNLVTLFEEFQPDFILSVPRVFEKVYNTAQQKAHDAGALKGRIFDAAAETAIAWSEAGGRIPIGLRAKHAVYDRLVYAKLRAALGGKCQAAISGGAPLGARLGHFYTGIGIPVYEGYGLTETTAAVTLNLPGAVKIGSVGKPLPGNGVRVAEDGELLARGGVVFRGYWKNGKATAESFDGEWFRTGDIGEIDEDGYVAVTGRKKDIIVTAAGKNVVPAGLEDALRSHPLISQAVVVGDQRPFVGALITIDSDAFPRWKAANSKSEQTTLDELVDDSDLASEIDRAVQRANSGVSNAEAIKKFRILAVDFTEESGELTPTLKVKRNIVQKRFSAEIDALYG
ncbi:long-chain fatty acid--CoA ligase [Antrihabitans sp. YC2-6]|uniref:AMP-dependent synthetase/ligase n=1 Tax=Antrihabitans sp. YC2-6 TaxID=2799498 RepID=UPI0018F49525|nr:long-chain fatty acid--CoA ligase [Antrihabitans sp. YC2-6]MBJ8347017.1 long-chain fatty acid--CoA ligase [Antrihabitans sp. YC2-6]